MSFIFDSCCCCCIFFSSSPQRFCCSRPPGKMLCLEYVAAKTWDVQQTHKTNDTKRKELFYRMDRDLYTIMLTGYRDLDLIEELVSNGKEMIIKMASDDNRMGTIRCDRCPQSWTGKRWCHYNVMVWMDFCVLMFICPSLSLNLSS